MSGDYSRGSRQSSARDYPSSRGDDRRDRDRDRDRERERPRRRSRSPGHRGPRNDYNGGADSYSSSRGYREREREDRYSGRDRRVGDRDWDRDRGGGGYDRRDREPRRDYDDRRRGGRRDDAFPSNNRRDRDPSPPRKPKEPTPDLTDVVPILERKRRLTQWDIKPAGYENISAEQAKLGNVFTLPGAPQQQKMDQSRLEAFLHAPGNSASSSSLNPANAKQAKRMFAHNISHRVTDNAVREFVNLHLNGLNVASGRDPCVAAQVSKDKNFAMLEFRSAEDATLSLSLDGVEMEVADANGNGNGSANPLEAGLQIKRPKDYIAPSKSEDTKVMEGQVSNTVPDTVNKICVTRLPAFIDEGQAKELLASFGELKSFILVRDEAGDSRGVAFCEYRDAETVTDVAIENLSGMDLGDNKIKLFRACTGAVQAQSEMSVNTMSMLAGTENKDVEQGRVLCLHNMVTAEELYDNDEYEEISEDIKEECEKFGEILDMKIPRPSGGSKQSDGVGKIYLKYDSPESATAALRALAGRRFSDRTVVVSFFPEEYFDVNAW